MNIALTETQTMVAESARELLAAAWPRDRMRDYAASAPGGDAADLWTELVRSDFHTLLAPGHPGLNTPEELRSDPRAVHAYEPHEYASSVTVVGAGLAAATEWLNALAAGSEVVSVRRREPVRRPLNVPREYFSQRGLVGYHRLQPPERAGRLRTLLAPSYPGGRDWD